MTDIRTVALMLGPYRNLTTFVASTLSLHPQVQVLNHAAKRVWEDGEADFIGAPAEERLDAFIEKALDYSAGGRRGAFGGSILHSHGFDDPTVREAYARRYGDALVKPGARCLLWKESMRVQNRLAAAPGAVETLMAELPRVRFVLPLRNPLACAASNLKTEHHRFLGVGDDPSFRRVLDAVLRAFDWGLALKDAYPDRVFVLPEHRIGADTVAALADFLGLEPDPEWRGFVEAAVRVRPAEAYAYGKRPALHTERARRWAASRRGGDLVGLVPDVA